MTGYALYELAKTQAQLQCLIPKGLTASLPRLEWMEQRLILQFWYFRVDYHDLIQDYSPLYYAALDARTYRLIAFEALGNDTGSRGSFLGFVFPESFPQEREYLDRCISLLEKATVTEEEIVESQALWLDAQCGSVADWAQMHSGIRMDAIHKLLAADPESKTRNLATLWKNELLISGFLHRAMVERGLLREENPDGELCRAMYQELLATEGHIFGMLESRQPRCAFRL